MKKLIALVTLFMFAAVMSYAAETVSATGTAKAKIIQAATLTHATGAALDFGVLVADSDGGTVVVPAVATPTPTDTGIKRASGDVTSDHFTLANLDTATSYAVSLPSSLVIKNANEDEMTVSSFTVSETPVTGVTSKELYVGGTLTIGANQASGSYQGDYTVTVTY